MLNDQTRGNKERMGDALAMRLRGARRGGQAVGEIGAEKPVRRAAKAERR